MPPSTDPNIIRKARLKPLVYDGLIAALLGAVSVLLSMVTFGYLDPVLYGLLGIDFWFQSDMTRVFYNMMGVESSHYRTSVHPLFSLIAYHAAFAVEHLVGLFRHITDEQSAQLIIAGVAGVWTAILYSLLRLIYLPRFDAALFSLLGLLSSASLFWFSVPETYSFGSVSILLALVAAAVHQRRGLAEGWFAAASAATLSITITNWMAGLGATFFFLKLGRALRVTIIAFISVYLLWMLEKYLFPAANSFLNNSGELNYIFREETGGPLHIMMAFFSTTVVMPEVQLVGKLDRPDWLILSVQHSFPWQGGVLTLAAFCGWLSLLGLGLWHLFWGPTAARLRLLIGALLAGQLVLHLIYGEETFLYSLHFLPLLIVTAALSVTGQFRRLALVLAAAVLITAGTNNVIRFREARQIMIEHFYPDRGTGSVLRARPPDSNLYGQRIMPSAHFTECAPAPAHRPGAPSGTAFDPDRRG